MSDLTGPTGLSRVTVTVADVTSLISELPPVENLARPVVVATSGLTNGPIPPASHTTFLTDVRLTASETFGV